jgi:hypothetical protein
MIKLNVVHGSGKTVNYVSVQSIVRLAEAGAAASQYRIRSYVTITGGVVLECEETLAELLEAIRISKETL